MPLGDLLGTILSALKLTSLHEISAAVTMLNNVTFLLVIISLVQWVTDYWHNIPILPGTRKINIHVELLSHGKTCFTSHSL
jgi:membrane protein required for beta-lactamase induction